MICKRINMKRKKKDIYVTMTHYNQHIIYVTFIESQFEEYWKPYLIPIFISDVIYDNHNTHSTWHFPPPNKRQNNFKGTFEVLEQEMGMENPFHFHSLWCLNYLSEMGIWIKAHSCINQNHIIRILIPLFYMTSWFTFVPISILIPVTHTKYTIKENKSNGEEQDYPWINWNFKASVHSAHNWNSSTSL